jgi:hypothetical protein
VVQVEEVWWLPGLLQGRGARVCAVGTADDACGMPGLRDIEAGTPGGDHVHFGHAPEQLSADVIAFPAPTAVTTADTARETASDRGVDAGDGEREGAAS